MTIGELRAPKSIERLIWERKNAYPYFYLLYLLAQNASQICELGIRSGRSTRAILFGLKNSQSGTLTSIDLPSLSPFYQSSIGRPHWRRHSFLHSIKNLIRPWLQDGASWTGDSETYTTVKRLNRLGLSNWFSHLEADFFSLDTNWFSENLFDFIFIDFDSCDFVEVFKKFLEKEVESQVIAVHNSRRKEEQSGIRWLKAHSSYRGSVSFDEGLGLTLVHLDNK